MTTFDTDRYYDGGRHEGPIIVAACSHCERLAPLSDDGYCESCADQDWLPCKRCGGEGTTDEDYGDPCYACAGKGEYER